MGFLKELFSKKKPTFNKVLIDIGGDSVAGAYACYQEGARPTILSAHRLPIALHADEPPPRSMLRALHALGDVLIREGAPHVARATGSAAADHVVASIDRPWAEVLLRIKHINPREPLFFDQELESLALADAPVEAERTVINESLVGSILNGYPTRDPYGKQAHRVTLVALSSHSDTVVYEKIIACLRQLFHIDYISLIGGGSLRFQALRDAFAHERSAAILDATGSKLSLTRMHEGIPTSISEAPDIPSILEQLSTLKDRYSLPRTLFILERDSRQSSLRPALEGFRPLNVVSVRPEHLSGHVYHAAPTAPDLPLLLTALHARDLRMRG